ncbi:MAG: hypothetical protein LBJ67_13605 [Planctomycetaceae bacterium]|jgi:hypothetical protein|nr:hypothetical protein [Planctomycetaceae bacterium]
MLFRQDDKINKTASRENMSEEGKTDSQKAKIPFKFVFGVLLVVGGLYLGRHYEVRLDDKKGIVVTRRVADGKDSPSPQKQPPQNEKQPSAVTPTEGVLPMTTFTIATWDLSPLDFEKMADATRAQRIAEVMAQFDLTAVQGLIRTALPLNELVRRMNTDGKKFAYVIPKNLGNMPESAAFLFNTAVVKYDPEKTYELESSVLSSRPLVSSFCTVAPPQEQAFTFNLINVKISDNRKEAESQILGAIFRQVRDGDQAEDDVILLGNFGVPVAQAESLRSVPYLAVVHENLPTSINGIYSTENIAFDKLRTIEYVGGVQTVDLIKRFNLNLGDAKRMTEHLPLSAKFSVFEAGSSGK